jgi:urease gamma subunit
MPKLNIAFDGKSSQELIQFISENREIFTSKDLHIKLNDMIAEIGIE